MLAVVCDSSPLVYLSKLQQFQVEAIVLACEKGAVLITDDGLGRGVAQSFGVEVTGTVGVLIRAKRQGHLPSVRPLIDQLKRETNFRLSEALYQQAVQVAGESVPTEYH
jgi:predicted nucleic acid-binding protein